MSEVIVTLIASLLGAGGGLTAVISILVSRSKERSAERRNDIDDRILAWQKIADKHEQEMYSLKQELEQTRMDNRYLELYIRELTVAMAKAAPSVQIPPYPGSRKYKEELAANESNETA